MAKCNQKEVHQYTEYGRYLHTYESMALAASVIGVSVSSISQAIKHRTKCKGYLWAKNPQLKKKE